MKIEILKKENAYNFIVNGVQYVIPFKETKLGLVCPSVKDVENFFQKQNPEIVEEVSNRYYDLLWGGMTFRKGNANAWGWNGGRNYHKHRW